MKHPFGFAWLLLVGMSGLSAPGAEPIPPIPRVLPPPGIEIPNDERLLLETELKNAQEQFTAVATDPLAADAAVYLKAVSYALRYVEFYDAKDFAKAHVLLKVAQVRIAELAAGKHSWTAARGRVVRGYRSSVDGSPQPYGLEIPEGLDLAQPVPLYVWLHGRGDKETDLHFIVNRQAKAGQIAPPGAIVLHPFGRHCLGFKSAGEIDVLEAIFLVVLHSGKSKHERVQQWVEFELEHFLARWRAVFRGEPRVKRDSDVTADDIQKYHLIVWGDPSSNSLLAKGLPDLSLTWTDAELSIGKTRVAADSNVPLLIRPNPLNPTRYIVVNSGPTFREAHDKTNSQQNPKLPDWALIDLSQPPTANAPGRIAAAGFYDEAWQVK